MDFGYIPFDNLTMSDFLLPAPVFHYKPAQRQTKYRVGFPKWGRKEWVGTLYPKGTRDADFLNNYVHHFNTIELNATHYKINTAADVEKWANKAKDVDFKFCPKVPQLISHYSQFQNTDKLTTAFLEGVLAFGKNLGPIFLQVGDKFAPTRRDALFNYIKSLPTDVQFFLEVRHPDWFSDKTILSETVQTLKEANTGLVISDTPGRRDVVHMQFTIPTAFVRFSCDGKLDSDKERVQAWKSLLDNNVDEAYFMLHCHDDVASVDLSKYVKGIFGLPGMDKYPVAQTSLF